ncbi:hypothetical protein V7O67_13215 [Methanolobus sp. ZRKC4]
MVLVTSLNNLAGAPNFIYYKGSGLHLVENDLEVAKILRNII